MNLFKFFRKEEKITPATQREETLRLEQEIKRRRTKTIRNKSTPCCNHASQVDDDDGVDLAVGLLAGLAIAESQDSGNSCGSEVQPINQGCTSILPSQEVCDNFNGDGGTFGGGGASESWSDNSSDSTSSMGSSSDCGCSDSGSGCGGTD